MNKRLKKVIYFSLLGLLCLIGGLALNYRIHQQHKHGQIFESSIDKLTWQLQQKIQDLRYRFHQKNKPPQYNDFIFVGIDEKSLKTIGRWPWDRKIVAQVLEEIMKYQPSSVGLDIGFPEPQSDSGSDLALAEVIRKSNGRIVPGLFPGESITGLKPFQDICLAEFNTYLEQFKADKAGVELNSFQTIQYEFGRRLGVTDKNLLVDSTLFEAHFQTIFTQIQQTLQQDTAYLKKKFSQDSYAALNDIQKNILDEQWKYLAKTYCQKWPLESFYGIDEKNVQKSVQEILADSESLASYPPEKRIRNYIKLSYKNKIPQFDSWVTNAPAIQAASSVVGTFTVGSPDPDGNIRSYPLIFRTGNKEGFSYVPSLALATIMASNPDIFLDIELQDEQKTKSKDVTQIKIVTKNKEGQTLNTIRTIRTDTSGRIHLNFRGIAPSYTQISASEFLNPSENIEIQNTRAVQGGIEKYTEIVPRSEFLRNKIIVFGAEALGLNDSRVTPVSEVFLGPEIHLTAIDNILNSGERFMTNETFLVEIISMTAIAVLLIIGAIFIETFWFIGLLPFGFLSLTVGSLLAVQDTVIYSLSPILLLYVMQSATFATMAVLFDRQQKKVVLSTFSKYVSKEVVKLLLSQSEKVSTAGQLMNVTVFFSDLRGFTSLSEKLSPQELVSFLNSYFDPMTQIILNCRGTLDKYIGDAIMAFFGAPYANPSHARDAIKASILQIHALQKLNYTLKERGFSELQIGIGLHTGEVSVGSIGSTHFQNYTVIGDNVNLASRIESLTKTYGAYILTSEYTIKNLFTDREKIPPYFEFEIDKTSEPSTKVSTSEVYWIREVDMVQVKGKEVPVRLYEVFPHKIPKELAPKMRERLELFQKALYQYYSGNFSDAIVGFDACIELNKNEDFFKHGLYDQAAILLRERCTELNQEKIDNWSGIFKHKSK